MYIEIDDTGIGIKAKDLVKLFKLFGKLQDNQKLNKNGTGLGLSICKKIIKSMQGTVMVDSNVGKGTVFKMYVLVGIKNPNVSGSCLTKSILAQRNFHHVKSMGNFNYMKNIN